MMEKENNEKICNIGDEIYGFGSDKPAKGPIFTTISHNGFRIDKLKEESNNEKTK